MKNYIENYIGYYENALPEGFCEHLITEFERISKNTLTLNRQDDEGKCPLHVKDEYYYFNISLNPFNAFRNRDVKDLIYDSIQQGYDKYTQNFSILKKIGNLTCNSIKFQKTTSGGGYHTWHCEQESGYMASRVLVYMFYLNSLNEQDGGETEFMYQKLRITPKENTLMIWPAAFTHTHRGNMILSDASKYILTGWFVLDE